MGMRRPLVMASVAFAAGVYAAVELRLPAGLAFPAAGLCFLAAWYAHRRERAAAAVLVLLAFGGLGMARAAVETAGHTSGLLADLETHLYLTGTVAAEPRRYADRDVYLLRAEVIRQGNWQRKVDELVQLTVFTPADRGAAGGEGFHYGDRLEVYGQLRLPPVARNPGELDYRSYLARQGVYTQVTLEGVDQVRRAGRGPVNPLLAGAWWVKGRAVRAVEANLPPEEAGVLLALLFGDQERLGDRQGQAYRSLGLFHLFAVSGMQVAFVLLFFLQAGRTCRLGGRGQAALAAGGVLGYAILTGFSPSVLRASLMALVALGAPLANRRQDSYTSLALAALLLLFWQPLDLFDRGFQLSFLATCSLIYLYPLLQQLLVGVPGRTYVALTLAAQLGVQPFSVYLFNLLSPAAILANLLVVPVVGAVTVAGLGLLLLAVPAPGLAAPVALACGAVLQGVQFLLNHLVQVPGAALSVATPGRHAVFLSMLSLVAARELLEGTGRGYWRHPGRENRGRLAAVSLLAVAALLPLWHSPPRGLTVTFLDVGQGSAVHVALPGGGDLLVDGGGRPPGAFTRGRDVGERVVVPYLIRQGAVEPWIFSSHPDSDHLLGLLAVMQELRPPQVVTPPRAYFGDGYAGLLELATRQAVPLSEARRGTVYPLPGGGRLEVLHPAARVTGGRSADNDNSLVLRLVYGDWSLLLPGDLEETGMRELRQAGKGIDSTVFNVPHHGSRYGLEEEFLAGLQPAAVVIQVGEGNSFGHPAPEVLRYWEERGVPVYRTDRDGAIVFWTDGRAWTVRTMLGSRRPAPWEPAPPGG